MNLNVLANGKVGNSIGVLASEVGNGPQLLGTHHAVGNADAHHEALQRPAFAALPAGHSRSIALGIHAPPAEISPDPFGRDGVKSLAGKAPDFFQPLPRIHRPLQALRFLRFGLFRCVCHKTLKSGK